MSEEIEYLKNRINLLENKLNYYENECNVNTNDSVVNGLHLSEYKRYGRQMVLNGIGLPGKFLSLYIHFPILIVKIYLKVN